MLNRQINEFGKRLGIPGLALNSDGIAGLTIEGVGRVTLETGVAGCADDFFVCLSRKAAPSSEPYGAMLARVNWRTGLPVQLAAAYHKDEMVFAARMRRSEVTAAGIENTLRLLLSEISRY
ncbi:MAG: hypothetical protein HUK26_03575 [Duodenibacillus sp.]|nr:hypothetical protein [Duodenibacillus sp.]